MSERTSGVAAPNLVPAPKKGGFVKKLLLSITLLAVLGGGGAAGFFWWQGQAAQAGPVEEPQPVSAREPNAVLPLEPFVVNLSDAVGSRFLRVNLRLLLHAPQGDRDVKALASNEVVMARLRSALLELLSTQTADELITSDGKDALKEAIKASASSLLPGFEVQDVLFSEFVVQF